MPDGTGRTLGASLGVDDRPAAIRSLTSPAQRKALPMPLVSSSNAQARLLRAVSDQSGIAACPERLNHIVLLADQHPDSKGAIDLAVEWAERFSTRLTLMHGGNLRPDSAFWTSDSQEVPDPSQTRLALLGLLWEVRKRCPDVGLCTTAARFPEQVWQAAAALEADLLVLPAGLFERFEPWVDRSGQEETVSGTPCTVLVVESPAAPAN